MTFYLVLAVFSTVFLSYFMYTKNALFCDLFVAKDQRMEDIQQNISKTRLPEPPTLAGCETEMTSERVNEKEESLKVDEPSVEPTPRNKKARNRRNKRNAAKAKDNETKGEKDVLKEKTENKEEEIEVREKKKRKRRPKKSKKNKGNETHEDCQTKDLPKSQDEDDDEGFEVVMSRRNKIKDEREKEAEVGDVVKSLAVSPEVLALLRMKSNHFCQGYKVKMDLRNENGMIRIKGTEETTNKVKSLFEGMAHKTLNGVLVQNKKRLDLAQVERENQVFLRPFPRDENGISSIMIYGSDDQLISAQQVLEKYLAPLPEENHEVEVWIAMEKSVYDHLKIHKWQIGEKYRVKLLSALSAQKIAKIQGRMADIKSFTAIMKTLTTRTVRLPSKYVGFVIGEKGAKKMALEREYDVQLYFPKRDEKERTEGTVEVFGVEERVLKAAQHITAVVDDKMQKDAERRMKETQMLDVDVKYIGALIGKQGAHLRDLEGELQVQMKIFGNKTEEKSKKCAVTGKKEN
ncbi:hypothetical protein SK128_022342, partial [Halocaridina rubra]